MRHMTFLRVGVIMFMNILKLLLHFFSVKKLGQAFHDIHECFYEVIVTFFLSCTVRSAIIVSVMYCT